MCAPEGWEIQEAPTGPGAVPLYLRVAAMVERLGGDNVGARGYGDVEEVHSAEEHLVFALPPELRRDLKAAGKR